MAWLITIGHMKPNDKHRFESEGGHPDFESALNQIKQAAIDKANELEVPWEYATVSPGVEYGIPADQNIRQTKKPAIVQKKPLKWE